MTPKSRLLWNKQDQHKGDRHRLFHAINAALPTRKVLYAGSYVDIAPSFVYADVTYVDVDNRASAFFDDTQGVRRIIRDHDGPTGPKITFMHGDYRSVPLATESYGLLISLYAGFISEPCGHALRIGGVLLVNSSHGDAALAALDPRFQLTGVVIASSGQYRVSTDDLDTYMVPKKPQTITNASIKASGRGIAYTKSPFAYLFERIR